MWWSNQLLPSPSAQRPENRFRNLYLGGFGRPFTSRSLSQSGVPPQARTKRQRLRLIEIGKAPSRRLHNLV
jgi:hypothetical protein